MIPHIEISESLTVAILIILTLIAFRMLITLGKAFGGGYLYWEEKRNLFYIINTSDTDKKMCIYCNKVTTKDDFVQYRLTCKRCYYIHHEKE